MPHVIDWKKVLLHLIVFPGVAFLALMPVGYLTREGNLIENMFVLPLGGAGMVVAMFSYAYIRFGLPRPK
mgnify:CR=1 FL=1